MVDDHLGIPRDFIYGKKMHDFLEKIDDGTPLSRTELCQIDRTLARVEHCIQMIDEVTKQSNWTHGCGLSISALLPAVQEARTVARLLAIKAYRLAEDGQLDLAIDCFDQTLRLSRGLRLRGSFVQQLVSKAVESTMYSCVVDVLGNSKLTVAHSERILKLLTEHQEIAIDALAEGLRMDYVAVREDMEKFRRGELPPGYWGGMSGSDDQYFDFNYITRIPQYASEAILAWDEWFKIAEPVMQRPYTFQRFYPVFERRENEFFNQTHPLVDAISPAIVQIADAFINLRAQRSNIRLISRGPFALLTWHEFASKYQDRIHGEEPTGTTECLNCNRVLALSSRICPKCDHRR